MTEVIHWAKDLRRPRLLLEAARNGISDYDRARVLKKFTSEPAAATPTVTLSTLIPVEESLEDARKSGDASYVPSRHVEVLIAILAELRSLVWTPRAV